MMGITMNNPLSEIDEKIAEHIMEFDVYPCCIHGMLPADCFDHRFDAMPRFRPSTYLLHAWQVVLKMQERGYEVGMNISTDKDTKEARYYVEFMDTDFRVFSSDGSAITSVICSAALKAATYEG